MSQTKERPILFSAPMVRAILEGRKTQTRRVVKLQTEPTDYPQADGVKFVKIAGKQYWWNSQPAHPAHVTKACPYGQPGDRLWVRETHCAYGISKDGFDHFSSVHYRADGDRLQHKIDAHTYRKLFDTEQRGEWTPSIHMPRWASRILLEITAVRVERLKDISEADALAEGIESLTGDKTIYHWDFPKPRPKHAVSGYKSAQSAYKELWAEINGRESLDDNPWVWVVEFKQLKCGAA